MKNNKLTKKVNFPEETESGRQELTGLAKLFFDEGREEEKASVVLNLLKNGFDYMTISTITQYPEAKVKELQDRFIREGLLPA